VGHSLGGTIAILLSQRRPDLVAGLVAIEPNLDPWDGDASVNIARQSEDEFVRTGYLDLLAAAPPAWASTLRVADPIALHRTAVHLCELRGDTPRAVLLELTIERTLLWGARSRQPPDRAALAASGVSFRLIPDAGHVPMEDNPVAFVRILADAWDSGRVDPTA
jgi:pimeloyl-ACP methyl ester carboxylesterase